MRGGILGYVVILFFYTITMSNNFEKEIVLSDDKNQKKEKETYAPQSDKQLQNPWIITQVVDSAKIGQKKDQVAHDEKIKMEEQYPYLQEDKEKKKSVYDKVNDFFIQNWLDKERLVYKNWNNIPEKDKLYNARATFVQYLHYLGIKLFLTSQYMKQWESQKLWKDIYDDWLKNYNKWSQEYKLAPMYKNWMTTYHGAVTQSEKLRKFIEENKDKIVINWIKLPWWKTLSQLTVPKARK